MTQLLILPCPPHPEYDCHGKCVACGLALGEVAVPVVSCHHCLRYVPANEAVPARCDGERVLHCFSCGTGLPYDEFKRLKAAGLPLPTYSKEPT